MYSHKIQNEILSDWTRKVHHNIDFADSMSQPRTQWPAEYDKFPINKFKRIQKIILKILSALSRDQRVVNHALINALRDSTILNQTLQDELHLLRKRVTHLENAGLRKSLINEPTLPRLPQSLMDKFYWELENRFRGSQTEVSERLSYYLALFLELRVKVFGGQNPIVIDLGCGRGEWLELLEKHECLATGTDLNSLCLDECRAKKLDALQYDALSYLENLPDESVMGVTGFHIIEHLTFESLLKIFQEVARVLKPGGIAIFETPSPNNLLVAAYSFYLDPTHKNPLPAPLVQFIAEFSGLKKVRVHGLHPYPDSEKFSGSLMAEKFNEYFRSFQDYAIIGYR